jgi:transcription antitermination protein NusB
MTTARHKARVTALQALYEIDAVGRDPAAVVARIPGESGLSEETAAFAAELVTGVSARRAELDEQIKTYAPAWPVDQIAVIDRNVLRLAIFEILFDNKVPVKVAVSEAVELAKSFGSETSGKFVNGVLGSVSSHAERRDL